MRQDDETKITITAGGQSVDTTTGELSNIAEHIKQLPRQVWIRKIKVASKRVHIEYNVGSHAEEFDDMDATTIKPKDEAVQEFYDAFDKLAEFVPAICEMDEKYGVGMETISVSISYPTDNKVMGACITVSKKLTHNDAPLIITTPFKATDVYHDDGNPDILLPDNCRLALALLIDRAEDFVNGLRAPKKQEELFA